MPYVPRTVKLIRDFLLNGFTEKNELTDKSESSIVFQLADAIAQEFHIVEYILKDIRDSYDFNFVSGTHLDDRVAELPGKSITRLGGSAAAGAAMTLVRSEQSDPGLDARVIPAGTTFGRSDNPALTYALTSSVTIADGETEYPSLAAGNVLGAPVKCTIAGPLGNCATDTVVKIVSDDSGVLISCRNHLPIGGGRSVETDTELRVRAKAWLNSLARSQRASLINVMKSHLVDGQAVFKSVAIFENPNTPGLVELVVDDGTGVAPIVSGTLPDFGTVPLNGSPIINHKYPITSPFTQIYKYINNAVDFDPTTHLDKIGANDEASYWKGILLDGDASVQQWERGVIILGSILVETNQLTDATLAPGDIWALVYDDIVGPHLLGEPIASAQRLIEGKAEPDLEFPGYRAAGIRVVLTPPTINELKFLIQATFDTTSDAVSVAENVQSRVVDFCQKLGPGETLFISQLIADLIDNILGLKAVNFKDDGTGYTIQDTTSDPRETHRASEVKVI
jgi:hypothetical protein